MNTLTNYFANDISPTTKKWLHFLSLIGVVLASFSSHWLSEIKDSSTSPYLGEMGIFIILQFSLMAVFMLLAWATSPSSLKLKDYKLILLAAVIARVALLGVTPYTSNDVDRYLFDGRIAYEGIDPYRVSHDAPELIELRAQWQPPQEHAKYVTLYPPVALSLFALASSAGVEHAQLAWSAILLLSGLLTLYFSFRVLQHIDKLKHLSLVALSPLLILETGVGLHLDALSTLTVTIAIYLWLQQRFAACGFIVGIGMSLKILPMMLLLPFLFWLFGKKAIKTSVILVASTVTTALGIYVLAVLLSYHPIGSISVFFEKWRFASPLFNALDSFLSGYQLLIALLNIAVVVCLLIGLVSFSSARSKVQNCDLAICLQLALAIPLMLSPVLFPWYLMPLIPLLALRPNIYLITWTLLMPLTYEVISDFLCCQQWMPAQWPVIFIGVLYLITTIKLTHWLYTNKVELLGLFNADNKKVCDPL
ncbi:hypothetical protein JQC92_18130 [Shewanella sp. 202IG2-18]|uniref:hypothetical protein n=1 Tax=Parashewanella hymeniacidonis TaxID=2807618 RepID=UPI00195FC63E|nr:hypothetical protein [Parashewanella hymeniacidonis]MBM7073928.1 hypothetical protein [Parashewanella hymeniacidonis]